MKEKRDLLNGGGLIGAFALWTVMIQRIDVQAVGQNGTRIGFAAFNVWFHQLTGVHMTIYTITARTCTDLYLSVLWYAGICAVDQEEEPSAGRSGYHPAGHLLCSGHIWIPVL